MYEVNIDADPADFLDWDAPLSAQPPKVRNVLLGDPARMEALRPKGVEGRILERAAKQNEGAWADLDIVINNDRDMYMSAMEAARREGVDVEDDMFSPGEWLVNKHREFVSYRAPSDDTGRLFRGRESELRDAGIPGIKYLDAGSRGAGDGSRNYVVFDDRLITILRKYGIGGLIAGGGAYALTDAEYAQAGELLAQDGMNTGAR
jgi:hypothetical protein